MTIDTTAPIIPCGGAGSIILGSPLEAVPNAKEDFVNEPVVLEGMSDIGVMRYRSACVDFWTDSDNQVYQVMVHDDYAGKLLGKIGVGSLLSDIEQFLGPLSTIDDSLVVKGLAGIAFEPEIDMPDSPIIEIYVWKPDWTEIIQHQAH